MNILKLFIIFQRILSKFGIGVIIIENILKKYLKKYKKN